MVVVDSPQQMPGRADAGNSSMEMARVFNAAESDLPGDRGASAARCMNRQGGELRGSGVMLGDPARVCCCLKVQQR